MITTPKSENPSSCDKKISVYNLKSSLQSELVKGKKKKRKKVHTKQSRGNGAPGKKTTKEKKAIHTEGTIKHRKKPQKPNVSLSLPLKFPIKSGPE